MQEAERDVSIPDLVVEHNLSEYGCGCPYQGLHNTSTSSVSKLETRAGIMPTSLFLFFSLYHVEGETGLFKKRILLVQF